MVRRSTSRAALSSPFPPPPRDVGDNGGAGVRRHRRGRRRRRGTDRPQVRLCAFPGRADPALAELFYDLLPCRCGMPERCSTDRFQHPNLRIGDRLASLASQPDKRCTERLGRSSTTNACGATRPTARPMRAPAGRRSSESPGAQAAFNGSACLPLTFAVTSMKASARRTARKQSRALPSASLRRSGASDLLKPHHALVEKQISAGRSGRPRTDLYFASFTLPDFLNYLLAAGGLSVVFIPMFFGILRTRRPRRCRSGLSVPSPISSCSPAASCTQRTAIPCAAHRRSGTHGVGDLCDVIYWGSLSSSAAAARA